jgi:hypothetical protein
VVTLRKAEREVRATLIEQRIAQMVESAEDADARG